MLLPIFVLCAPAVIVAAVGLFAGLFFLSRVSLPRVQRTGKVTLILPLTGKSMGLVKLLNTLESQTLRPRRLLICVEDEHDPAYLTASQLAKTTNIPVEVVVASQATECAQKCSNQMAGLSRIDADDEVVVLLDGDIRPPSWWLSALTTPILDNSADIVTGYRWPMLETQRASTPVSVQLAFHFLASIDRGIALLPRLGRFQVTWGGTLAISPRALERLGMAQVLAYTLSDDCTIGSRASALGLRILTRSALLVPTPTDHGLVALCRFGHRQYQIIRVYRPQLWWLALLAQSSRVVAWVVVFLNPQQLWAHTTGAALLFFALAGVLVQAAVAHRLGLRDSRSQTVLQVALVLFKPVVDIFHWALIVAAFDSRVIRWGHLTYRIDAPEKVAVVARTPWR